MGDLITTIRVGGKNHTIKPIERRLHNDTTFWGYDLSELRGTVPIRLDVLYTTRAIGARQSDLTAAGEISAAVFFIARLRKWYNIR